MRDMTRAAFKALDIPLLAADEDASPTVTAVRPVDFDSEALRSAVKEQFNLTMAGGQQHPKDRFSVSGTWAIALLLTCCKQSA